MRINPLVEQLKPSATLTLNQKAKSLAKEGRSIINMTAGEPDFLTPERVRAAAKTAMDRGETHYTAVSGVEPLRKAIAENASKVYDRAYSAQNVIVSNGAKQSLFNIFCTILCPGDEVVMFAPYWVSYADVVSMVGGKPVVLPTRLEENFEPDLSALEAAITGRTRAVVINCPSNPTGAVYSERFFQNLAGLLAKRPEVLVITDDIYGQLIYDGKPFVSIAKDPSLPAERIVVVSGVSKTYAMTGWRIGWAIASKELVGYMDTIQGQTTSNAGSISQWAALEAIQGDQRDVETMRKEFERRRNYICDFFSAHLPMKFQKPQGAFYLFPSCESMIGKKTPQGATLADDVDVSMYLLEQCGVGVVPGSAFGAPGYIRLSYSLTMDSLEEGVRRLEKGYKELR